MIPNHFVILWDGQPVGLDRDSGGYPYKTGYPGSIHYWKSAQEALDYMAMFREHNWQVVEVQFRIVGEQ